MPQVAICCLGVGGPVQRRAQRVERLERGLVVDEVAAQVGPVPVALTGYGGGQFFEHLVAVAIE